jgi:hypothetical protein
MNVDYDNLPHDLESGYFRESLREELLLGFRQIHSAGERLPPSSHYASQIAEIVNRGAPSPLGEETKYELYQEILSACESARMEIMGEEVKPQ